MTIECVQTSMKWIFTLSSSVACPLYSKSRQDSCWRSCQYFFCNSFNFLRNPSYPQDPWSVRWKNGVGDTNHLPQRWREERKVWRLSSKKGSIGSFKSHRVSTYYLLLGATNCSKCFQPHQESSRSAWGNKPSATSSRTPGTSMPSKSSRHSSIAGFSTLHDSSAPVMSLKKKAAKFDKEPVCV